MAAMSVDAEETPQVEAKWKWEFTTYGMEHNQIVWQFTNNENKFEDMPPRWSEHLENCYQSLLVKYPQGLSLPTTIDWEETDRTYINYSYNFALMTQTHVKEGKVGSTRNLRRMQTKAPWR